MPTVKRPVLQTKHWVILYTLGIAAVLWTFLLLLYLPQSARNNELAAQLSVQRQQVASVEAFALSHPEADKYLAELSRKRASLDKMLPGTPDLSDFVVQVERAAKEAGVQVAQLKPAAAVSKEGYSEIPIEILIKGNFFQTASFLKKLEDGRRFMAVQTLSLQARPNGLDGKVNAVIYAFGAVPAGAQQQATVRK